MGKEGAGKRVLEVLVVEREKGVSFADGSIYMRFLYASMQTVEANSGVTVIIALFCRTFARLLLKGLGFTEDCACTEYACSDLWQLCHLLRIFPNSREREGVLVCSQRYAFLLVS